MPSRTATVNDIELAYSTEGEGPALLLVHGFPLDRTMWHHQIDTLSARYQVIAPDLRGYGKSSLGKVDPEAGVSMRQYADDLAGLLDAIGCRQPVVYCGFSMGGYIGWQFVQHHSARLKALIQCDTKATADNEETRAVRNKMAAHVSEWGARRVAEEMVPKLFADTTRAEHGTIVERMKRVISSTDPSAIAAAQLGMAARPDMTALLSEIKVPTLALCGKEDQLTTPDVMRAMAEAIPDAEYIEIAGAAHMAPVEKPQEVTAAMQQFLKRV